ncbi:hypothetical protein BC629DRAFT_1300122 [Irpex lacteus]|nr:hypothetical protein BC629DRAFT_1300122 [Irpex lacteus]
MNDETDTDLSPPGPETNLERGKIPKVTRKVAGRPGRKRQGKLRHMLDMPLDVVLEICSHLLPRDLLHLARTSKSLRSFFMSRSSRSMWKSACTNVPGLPPCPSDLSEPAYANLMFDAHCHVSTFHKYIRCSRME